MSKFKDIPESALYMIGTIDESKGQCQTPRPDLSRKWDMQPTRMNLKILLPFKIFTEKIGVLRIVAESREGSFGLLPHRLPGLRGGTCAWDTGFRDWKQKVKCAWLLTEGVLVKTGDDVLVSVRNTRLGEWTSINCTRR